MAQITWLGFLLLINMKSYNGLYQQIYSKKNFIDFEELGFEIYNIQIKTSGTKDFKKIIQFLKNQKSVFYYYQYFGNKDWDIDIGAIIKNKKELKELIQEIKQNFGGIISFKEIYMIEKIFKEELPSGVFD